MFEARVEKQIYSTLPKADKANLKNIQCVAEYASDILGNMK